MNKTSITAVALGLMCLACGQSVCERVCTKTRDQLINDFGVPPSQVNCADKRWQDADTCDKCRALLEHDYGVALTKSCDSY